MPSAVQIVTSAGSATHVHSDPSPEASRHVLLCAQPTLFPVISAASSRSGSESEACLGSVSPRQRHARSAHGTGSFPAKS